MILKAIMFWNEIYDNFPCKQVYAWMDAVSNNQADWFRNYGLTRVAVANNSKNGRGFFSHAKHEADMEKLAEIEAKYQDLVNLMQW